MASAAQVGHKHLLVFRSGGNRNEHAAPKMERRVIMAEGNSAEGTLDLLDPTSCSV